MKIIVEVDTRNPQSAEEIRREAQYLLYVAANLDTFLAGAAAAGAAVPADQISVTTLSPVPPPPPSVPEAPAAGAVQVPPPPPAADTTTPTVDSTGLPWDERIHSGKPTINADGKWKKRKGVTPPIVAAVEAELRGAAPSVQVPPPPPAVPEAPAAGAVQVPPPPPSVPATPASTPAAPPSPLSLLQRLAAAVGAGKLTVDEVIAECAKYGCANMGELAGNALAAAGVEAAFTTSGAI